MTKLHRAKRTSNPAGYPLEKVVQLTGVSRAVLVAYCESGVLPLSPDDLATRTFDDELIRAIRRIEVLREHHGINLTGIRMIRELMQEVERLRGELRFQAGR